MENTSGLKPVGHAVLVQHYESEEHKTSSIVMPDFVRDKNRMVEQKAIVVEIGPDAWRDSTPRAQVGDRVLISKMSGFIAKGASDGKFYRLVNDNDIFCQITDEQATSI